MPLDGASWRERAGSQSPPARRPVDRGAIDSQAASGESEAAIRDRTAATKSRTNGVSSTYSSSSRCGSESWWWRSHMSELDVGPDAARARPIVDELRRGHVLHRDPAGLVDGDLVRRLPSRP